MGSLLDTLSEWFAQFIQSNFPDGFAPYYLDPSDPAKNHNSFTSIIDMPETRLRYPMLNFDIDKNVDSIQQIVSTPATDERAKSMGIIVKGPGGGKTRSLEELKMELNKDRNGQCLAVAITYNARWMLEVSEFRYILKVLYPSEIKDEDYIVTVGVVFSVITRMASVLYGIPLLEIQALFCKEAASMPKVDIISFYLVLVAFIKAVVEDMRIRGGVLQQGRPIDSFVLFIDESKVVGDKLGLMGITGDVLAVIRQAFFHGELDVSAKIGTALVKSSLVFDKAFLTGSGRVCTPLELPLRLDSVEVVEKWWLQQLSPSVSAMIMASEESIVSLRLLAAVSAQLPRAVQLCGELLATRLNAGEPLNLHLFNVIMPKLVQAISARYGSGLKLPPLKYMRALLLNHEVVVTDEVSTLVSRGILSNALTSDTGSIIPNTSVIILIAAIKNKIVEGPLVKEAYAGYILDLYNCCIEQSRSMAQGDLLECIVLNLFKAKVTCVMMSSDQPAILADLLCLPSHAQASPLAALRWKYTLDVPLPVVVSGNFNEVELPSAYDDLKGFCATLANPNNLPTASVPYMFFVPSKAKGNKNSHDLMVACYTGPDQPPMTIVIELKSAAVLNLNQPSKNAREDLRYTPGGGFQYTRTKCHLESVGVPSGVGNTGLLKHIRDGNWVYVYMSTHDNYENAFAVENCMLLGPSEVDRFMGPFREVYRAARGAFDLGLKIQSERKDSSITPVEVSPMTEKEGNTA